MNKLAKRGKGGRERQRSKNAPVRVHRFLSEASRRFMVHGRLLPDQISPDDSAVMRYFLQIQHALGLRLTQLNAKLFLVDKPRDPHLPDGRKDNTRILWHGSRCENGVSILREGLRLGGHGMFGTGIYLGSREKALGYSGYSPGGLRWNYAGGGSAKVVEPTFPGMLLKVVAVLGRVLIADQAMTYLEAAPEGFNSVMGKKGHTKTWGDGRLTHDEWCIYNPCQVSIQEIHLLG